MGKDKRSPEAMKMLAKYPGRLPVICHKAAGWGSSAGSGPFADLPERKKFLVPSTMSCDGLRDTIRKHIKDTVHTTVEIESIQLQADGSAIMEESMQDIYDNHKADDCFLYISFSVEGSSAATGSSAISPPTADCPSSQRPGSRELGKEARKLLARHPNNIPVICEKASGSDAPAMKKNRFLVPVNMACEDFRKIVLDHIQDGLDAGAVCPAITLSSNSETLRSATLMTDIYEQYRSDDGFLYIAYDLRLLPSPDLLPTPSPQLPSADLLPQAEEVEEVQAEEPRKSEEEEREAPVAEAHDAAPEEEPTEEDGPTEETNGSEQSSESGHESVEDNTPECQEKDDTPQPVELPRAETGGTSRDSSQHEAAGPGGTKSFHMPDNDPDTPCADDSCVATQSCEPAKTEAPVKLGAAPKTQQHSERAQDKRLSEVRHYATANRNHCPPAIAPQKPAELPGDEASRMIAKFPGRVPVFCKRGRVDVPNIVRSKFLVPGTMLCSEFKYMIHRQLREGASGSDIGFSETIYLFLDNVSPKTGATMADLYARYKKDDNYLHITYSLENTLGSRRFQRPPSVLM